MSSVTQNGPAFLDRTLSTMAPISDIVHLKAEGLHGIGHLKHVVQAKFPGHAPVNLGRRKGKREGRHFFIRGPR